MSAPIGYVYILTNPGLSEGILKIGCTIHPPLERARQLSASTSAPHPFALAYSRRVALPFQVESQIHEALDQYRINDSREFFKAPLHKVIQLMERYVEVKKEERVSAANMKLPWAELFATFPDDGEGRELTHEEQAKCQELARQSRSQ